ncbi:MAG: serine/threonine protein kinase [Labilithrix sp.]|nr:serine/threonine protein kinase [Labilithrix sp.]MCW5817962.1 serine/threonine protein kinase [Labilithrix sp.]
MKLGTIIANKFRIERVIGRGAMGVVVEATDLIIHRRIAVKLILPHHAADPQLRGRFIREAQVMTRLTTEHVARVLEVGELPDGMLFLAMELLEGQTLEQLIQGGPLPVVDAVDLLLEALDAVVEAHSLGLVHRDIKPSNMFLAARKGKPPILKMLDFGIVKDTQNAQRLTATGTLPGTPAYMAPEQVAMEEHLIDARADVWALGITLYEILTGDVPFTGSMNEMLTKIRSQAPPRLRAKRPDVAPELENVINRCLSKHPTDRYANAGELAAALQDIRQRGLLRSERGAERREVQTEMSIVRRNARDAPTEADSGVVPAATALAAPKKSGSGALIVMLLLLTVVAVIALVVAMKTRLIPH